jgi:hypothetical protein
MCDNTAVPGGHLSQNLLVNMRGALARMEKPVYGSTEETVQLNGK